MNKPSTMAALAHARAASTGRDDSRLFVGTVWIIDEIEEALLSAARTVPHAKVARSTQNAEALRTHAAALKRAIGQAHLLSISLEREVNKYVPLRCQAKPDPNDPETMRCDVCGSSWEFDDPRGGEGCLLHGGGGAKK